MEQTNRQELARTFGRARRRSSVLDGALQLAVLAGIVAAAGRLGDVGCLAALIALPALVGAPVAFAAHRRSVRFGISRQTDRAWIGDQLKGSAVGLLFAGAAIPAVFALQRTLPGQWEFAVFGLALVVSAVLAVLFPVVLLPLFVRSEPLGPGTLARALEQTTAAAGVRVRELRLLHLGERTAAGNAMVAGLGPTLRVYVGDTLSADADESERIAETQAVLAHELGHYVSRDVWRLLGASAMSLAVGISCASAAASLLAPHGVSRISALPALLFGFGFGSALVSPLLAAYSRRREWAADRYAIALLGDGRAFANALERLASQNLAELHPPRIWQLLTASHPALGDRIRAARS